MDLAHIRYSCVKYLLFSCLIALMIFLILNPGIAKPPDDVFIQQEIIVNRGKDVKSPESPNKHDLVESEDMQNIVNSDENMAINGKKNDFMAKKEESKKSSTIGKEQSSTKKSTTLKMTSKTPSTLPVVTKKATTIKAATVVVKNTTKVANATDNEVRQSPLEVANNFTKLLLSQHNQSSVLNTTNLRSKRKPEVPVKELMARYESGQLRIDDLMDILEASLPSIDEEDQNVEKPEEIVNFESELDLEPVQLKFKNFKMDFNMTVNEENDCENATAVVMIMTTAGKHDYFQRLLIRYTYLGKSAPKHICHRFFIGFQPDMDVEAIKKEMTQFKDIVYYDTYDTYRRNFIKWFTMYAWQQRFAADVPILIKLDSDTAIDLKRTFKWMLRRFDTTLDLNGAWIVCEKMTNQQPVRSPKTNAWYVPVKEYAYDTYPPYCYGYAVIMSTLAVNLSLDAMKEADMFHMDDVLYTGVVAPLRQIPIYDFKGLRTQISAHIHESWKRKSFCNKGLPYPIALHNAKSPTSIHLTYELIKKIDCTTTPSSYHKRPYTFYEA